MSLFQKARKIKSKLRAAWVGPPGSGKSFTAATVGNGLVGDAGRIFVIDAEHGSFRKSVPTHLDIDQFDVAELATYHPGNYIELIKAAESEGADLIIIDSLSHAWFGKGGILEFVESNKKRYGGNSWASWADATPLHNSLIMAIISCKCHVIATMRTKLDFVIETDPNTGKSAPRKVGLAPIQREGMDYEFDLQADMTPVTHDFIVSKARALFKGLDGKILTMPGKELGQQLAKWLDEGVDASTAAAFRPHLDSGLANQIKTIARTLNLSKQQMIAILAKRGVSDIDSLTASDAAEIIERLEAKLSAAIAPVAAPSPSPEPPLNEDLQGFADRLDASHAEMSAASAAMATSAGSNGPPFEPGSN